MHSQFFQMRAWICLIPRASKVYGSRRWIWCWCCLLKLDYLVCLPGRRGCPVLHVQEARIWKSVALNLFLSDIVDDFTRKTTSPPYWGYCDEEQPLQPTFDCIAKLHPKRDCIFNFTNYAHNPNWLKKPESIFHHYTWPPPKVELLYKFQIFLSLIETNRIQRLPRILHLMRSPENVVVA